MPMPDGFRVEIDAAQRARRRGARPPAAQRHHDAAARRIARGVRGARRRPAGAGHRRARRRASIFPAAAKSAAFSKPRPSMSRASPGTSPRRRAARSRSSPPRAAIASASGSSWRSPAISASPRKPASMRCPSSGSARSPARAAPRGCRRWSASPAPRTSSCARAGSPARQAYDWGVATDCVPDAELEAATAALVDELRGFPAARPAHRQKAPQRHRGCDALPGDRARRRQLQPPAQLRRFPRRGRGLPRQAQAGVPGKLKVDRCGAMLAYIAIGANWDAHP